MLTPSEQTLLAVFRDYRIDQGEILCFSGPLLAKHRSALAMLASKGLLTKERFKGAYSLTPSGFAAMSASRRAGSSR